MQVKCPPRCTTAPVPPPGSSCQGAEDIGMLGEETQVACTQGAVSPAPPICSVMKGACFFGGRCRAPTCWEAGNMSQMILSHLDPEFNAKAQGRRAAWALGCLSMTQPIPVAHAPPALQLAKPRGLPGGGMEPGWVSARHER